MNIQDPPMFTAPNSVAFLYTHLIDFRRWSATSLGFRTGFIFSAVSVNFYLSFSIDIMSVPQGQNVRRQFLFSVNRAVRLFVEPYAFVSLSEVVVASYSFISLPKKALWRLFRCGLAFCISCFKIVINMPELFKLFIGYDIVIFTV